MQVLSCKQGCVTELASEDGQEKPIEDFLPSHFNYLQFAYYNSKWLLLSLSRLVGPSSHASGIVGHSTALLMPRQKKEAAVCSIFYIKIYNAYMLAEDS